MEDKYIESYEKWNLEADSQEKQDSVLYYIDKLIDISNDDFYKIEKIKILYRIEKYEDALSVFRNLKEQDSFAIDLFRSLIEIKDDPKNPSVILQRIDQKYESKELTREDRFYKIALDYYLQGRDYAIDEINNVVRKGELSKYEKELYEILQEKIQNGEDGLEVLFYLYNL
ncbi:hypothetical protein [Myroides odoratus]|uniref:hypothetical protein n=1 Tax=Myroides odoratus TaxID=256 RepID=UPI000AF120E5|nr:hypothetical protein [Myroides odoratus]